MKKQKQKHKKTTKYPTNSNWKNVVHICYELLFSIKKIKSKTLQVKDGTKKDHNESSNPDSEREM